MPEAVAPVRASRQSSADEHAEHRNEEKRRDKHAVARDVNETKMLMQRRRTTKLRAASDWKGLLAQLSLPAIFSLVFIAVVLAGSILRKLECLTSKRCCSYTQMPIADETTNWPAKPKYEFMSLPVDPLDVKDEEPTL